MNAVTNGTEVLDIDNLKVVERPHETLLGVGLSN